MIVGGLRARLLHDSVQTLIREGLVTLGWFETNRRHRPIIFLAAAQEWDEPVEFNTMVVVTRSRVTEFIELGTDLSLDTVFMGVDIYAESESLAVDLSNDVRDILRGRLTGGALRGSMPIFDYGAATPITIGHALITNVRATRLPPQPNRAYTRHWYGVDCNVLDSYYGSWLTYPGATTFPTPNLYPIGS